MSNIVAVFSKSARKPFKGASLDAAIGAILPPVRFPLDGDKITANQVSITDDMFRSSVGADLTPVSFANSTAYAVARFAYGARLDALLKGCTPALAHGMAAACANVKFGGGLTVGDLRGAIAIGFAALLALPVAKPKDETEKPEKPEKPAVVAPAVVAPAVVAPKLTADQAWFAMRENAHKQADKIVILMRRAGVIRAEVSARFQAEKKAQEEMKGPAFVEVFEKLSTRNHAQAEDMLREMAAYMGFKLVRKAKAVKIAA